MPAHIKYAGTYLSGQDLFTILNENKPNSGWAVTGGKSHVLTIPDIVSRMEYMEGKLGFYCFNRLYVESVTEIRRVGLSEIRVYGLYPITYENSKNAGGGTRTETVECLVLRLEHLPTVALERQKRELERAEQERREELRRQEIEAHRISEKARFEANLNRIFAGKNIRIEFPEECGMRATLTITDGDTGEMLTISQRNQDDGGGYGRATINHIPIDKFDKSTFELDEFEGEEGGL